MRSFIDTNILVYAFDSDEPEKVARAQRLLEREAASGSVVVSTQVLQEFYVAVTRKLKRPLAPEDAARAVREVASLPVVQVDPAMIHAAIDRSRSAMSSFWDALIVEAALAGGCSKLYTEDLQHGWRTGGLEVIDPFR